MVGWVGVNIEKSCFSKRSDYAKAAVSGREGLSRDEKGWVLF